ncbi:MAG: hypothetical protein ACTSU5_08800 [Promethearchaeota archaeon]
MIEMSQNQQLTRVPELNFEDSGDFGDANVQNLEQRIVELRKELNRLVSKYIPPIPYSTSNIFIGEPALIGYALTRGAQV